MPHANKPLRLFVVTLPWNPSNEEEGDYSNKTRAVDEEAAVLAIAQEMSHHPDSGCRTDAERKAFVKTLVEEAGSYAAEDVGARLLVDAHELMKGGGGGLTAQAQADFDAVAEILERYGATNPWKARSKAV